MQPGLGFQADNAQVTVYYRPYMPEYGMYTNMWYRDN